MTFLADIWNVALSCGALIGFALLVFAPGLWITFGLRLTAIPVWARVLTGAMLSPVVVFVEFYAVRWAGVPFGPAVGALCVANLPVFWFISRKSPKLSSFRRGTAAIALFTIAICTILMAKPLLSVGARIYSPHAWIYSDPAYMFARGDLNLEDPSLAGVPMGYPVWSALVFQTAVSFVLNSPPASSWVWVNLLWLIMICAFAGAIAKELGGGRLAQGSAAIWLMLGVNPVGYLLLKLLPGLATHRLFGDDRYTPWVNKFFLFSTMPLGLGMIAALLYLFVQPGRPTRPVLITAALLTAGTGLFYPLLFPAACGILAARGVADLWANRTTRLAERIRKLLPLAAVLLIAVLVTYAQVKYLGRARVSTTPELTVSTLSAGLRKGVVSMVVSCVLLIGVAFVLRKSWKAKPEATIVLIAGALASYFLHSAFSIAYWDNEYKFITVAAICLTPFAALATERIWRQWPRPAALATLTLTAALLFVPYVHKVYVSRAETPAGVAVTRTFYLKLNSQNHWSSICTAIRTLTPSNAILVLQNSDYYFPGLTARSMYVPMADRFYPGVTLRADVLEAGVRANGRDILAHRRAVVHSLFDSAGRQEALAQLLALGRPVVIVAEPQHEALLSWLRSTGRGSAMYERDGITVWLVAPGA